MEVVSKQQVDKHCLSLLVVTQGGGTQTGVEEASVCVCVCVAFVKVHGRVHGGSYSTH